MELVIFDTEQKYDEDFLEYLRKYIILNIIGNINKKKLISSEIYINQYTDITTIFKKYISSYDVVVSGASNIVYRIYNNKIVFNIDSTAIFPGTSAKLNDLCKLINYGNLVVQGYPIFTDTFEYFEKNIDDYYDNFINGGF